jgi:hypothetical protein
MKTMASIGQAVMILALLFGLFIQSFAQDDKAKRPSPPAQASTTVNGKTITIHYGQPSVKGREVWGKLVPYGQVWRTGANEATTFEVDQDVKIEGKPLPAGKYALFTIPNEQEWTLIFNKVPNQWGAFKYDSQQDVLRVQVKPQKAPQFTEMLSFQLKKNGKVALTWENIKVGFQVN